ncbi:hypothetical protein EON64_15620 [archaeon]|nr:MAG: hypothetical protein EON64_15620 [archaeon]
MCIKYHTIHHTPYTAGEKELYQQSQCFVPITSKVLVIRHASDATRMIDEAIYTALKEMKPVYLEIPVNLATFKVPVPADWSLPSGLPAPASDPITLQQAKADILTCINAAVKPVLLAGTSPPLTLPMSLCHPILPHPPPSPHSAGNDQPA